jgi:hypothetical protein
LTLLKLEEHGDWVPKYEAVARNISISEDYLT